MKQAEIEIGGEYAVNTSWGGTTPGATLGELSLRRAIVKNYYARGQESEGRFQTNAAKLRKWLVLVPADAEINPDAEDRELYVASRDIFALWPEYVVARDSERRKQAEIRARYEAREKRIEDSALELSRLLVGYGIEDLVIHKPRNYHGSAHGQEAYVHMDIEHALRLIDAVRES